MAEKWLRRAMLAGAIFAYLSAGAATLRALDARLHPQIVSTHCWFD